MARTNNIFTTIRTEGALLPADLLQRISEGANLDGLTPESYHRPGEKLNEAINRSWNALQGAWASFRAAQERLPAGDLGTTITRERWLLPLFRELDYGRLQTVTAAEIGGRSYPISHGWEHVPIHLVSYKLELDRRTPGATGAASASPHSLLQVFLNRSDANLWGFVSNGYKLRILRDNVSLTRQAYVEFDLEAMMEGEVYSDFVLLWLLCHQSRLEGERPSDCWLEKWMKVAEDQGTRALDQLRDGVEKAIEALGLGFLEYHANAALRDKLTSGELNAQDYYRQLLRMVYRLLFLFVAEDRDLLLNPAAPQEARERYIRHYSTQRLRRMAETFKGTRHPDLFESLRLVMRLLSGESPHPKSFSQGEKGLHGDANPPSPPGRGAGGEGLGLVPLGSFLFSDRAVTDVIDCQIANSHLLDAIRALSLTYDQRAQVYRTVDYKNLGSDELGSIFESLLELHPQINVPARRFALSTAAGNERKTTGSYYTPESLVHALLDSALNPVLEAAVRGPHPKSFSQGEKDSSLRSELARSKDLLRRGTKDAEQFEKIASQAMVQISRELRQRQTPTEEILWEALRDRRLNNLKFRRQHPVADTQYVVDFLCYEAKLVVEIDGGIHNQQKSADEKRQSEIDSLGYRVLRFTNETVQNDLHWVLATIAHAASQPSPGLSQGERNLLPADRLPSPLGRRAGDEGKGGLTAEERILALKVCDPACGSGHFLIAAANRMAKKLAEVRTGEEEPPPAAIQEAKRDIISHCIYGVDINPMAVELCKVNLWMEALEPGKPLSFLDHRIQVGNSLLGTTPKLMADGIPDEAFNPIEGDDPKFAAETKKLNREGRKQREAGIRQMSLFEAPLADHHALTDATRSIDRAPDDTLDQVRQKEAMYHQLANDPEYIKARLLADAWCAAFVWEKRPPAFDQNAPYPGVRLMEYLNMPLTDTTYRRLEHNPLAENLQPMRESIFRLAQRYQFFHWHVAFPDVFTVEEAPTPNPSPSGRGEQVSPPEGGRFRGGAYNPQTGWYGGFDLVLGNPPWERIKIQEKEWFAERAPEIASAPNAAARRRMIAELQERDPYLLQAFADDKRKAEGESHFVRMSERFPLCGRGDVNTYTIFAETSRHIINGFGRVGMIVPSGIATDDTTKFFFQDLMQTRSLASLYDFENREGLFPAVDSRMKFSLVTMRGNPHSPDPQGERGANRIESPLALLAKPPEGWERGFRGEGQRAEFAFFLHSVADLADEWRRFTLSAEDIAALNPNTGTMATFRSVRDAEITKAIYQRVPVLIRESPPLHLGEGPGVRVSSPRPAGEAPRRVGEGPGGEGLNPWGIRFATMFHMSNDSHLFRTRDELEAAGYTLAGNWFVKPPSPTLPPQGEGSLAYAEKSPHLRGGDLEGGQSRYLPLYEAKMMHQFTHRWATYTTSPLHLGEGPGVRDFTPAELRDPSALPMPRYWVDSQYIAAQTNDRWLLAHRKTARSTDERTMIVCPLPLAAVGDKAPLIFLTASLSAVLLTSGLNSLACDYVMRQKLGATDISQFYAKQLPVIPPHTYTPTLLNFIVPRVLELTYTAWDLQPFAQDLGYHGPPFIWDEQRRFLMRCELDALYFHLYQIPRDDVDYIMETFPIVRRKDIAATADGTHPLAPGLSGRGADQVPPPEGEGFRVGAEGEYITKRIILEMYDQMAALPTIPVPAPKSSPRPAGEAPRRVGEGPGVRASSPTSSSGGGENTSVSKSPHLRGGDLEGGPGEGTYLVPDVSQWQTWLNPPPASEEVAHRNQ